MDKQYLFAEDFSQKNSSYATIIESKLPSPKIKEEGIALKESLSKLFDLHSISYLHSLSLQNDKLNKCWQIYFNFEHGTFLEADFDTQDEIECVYNGVFGDNFEAMAGLLIEITEKLTKSITLERVDENTLHVDIPDPEKGGKKVTIGYLQPSEPVLETAGNRRLVERAMKNVSAHGGSEKLTKKLGALHSHEKDSENICTNNKHEKQLLGATVRDYNENAWCPSFLCLNSFVSKVKSIYCQFGIDVAINEVQKTFEAICGENWNVLKYRELNNNQPSSVMYERNFDDEYELLRPVDAMVNVALLGGVFSSFTARFNWYDNQPMPSIYLNCEGDIPITYRPVFHYAAELSNESDMKKLMEKWSNSVDIYPLSKDEVPEINNSELLEDESFAELLVKHIEKIGKEIDVYAEVHELYLYENTQEDIGTIKIYAPGGFPDLDDETPYEYGFDAADQESDLYFSMQSFMARKLTSMFNLKENKLWYKGACVDIVFQIDYSPKHFSGPDDDSFGNRLGVIC